MFTVRTVSGKGAMRDARFDTKREALRFIKSLGDLSFIKRVDGRIYVVTPNNKRAV